VRHQDLPRGRRHPHPTASKGSLPSEDEHIDYLKTQLSLMNGLGDQE
jgi:hypothetical protein